MSAADTWILVVVGHAVMLSWPAFTVTLAGWAARYSAARLRRHGQLLRPRAATPDYFWIVVPALNEEVVVGRTVTAALGLTGPAGTLARVLVVDDGSDDATPQVLAGLRHPRLNVLRRELPAARQGKGEALNAAYRWIVERTAAEGADPARVVVGIIDGDGQGSPNLLLEVSRRLHDEAVGAVQCQVRIRNRHRILGAVQDLEFGAVVSAFQTLRDRLGTVGLGGNGQFTRLSALMSLGRSPWSECLVEDLELGLRLHLSGVEIRFTSRAAVTQQAVVDIRRLTRQRTRWAQGNLQCARYLNRLLTTPAISPPARVEMLHYLLAPWLNAIMMVALVVLSGVAATALLVGEPMPYAPSWRDLATTGELWLFAMLFPGFVWASMHRRRHRDEGLARLLAAALAYPAFLILGIVATYRAVFRHAVGRQAWAKTERLTEDPALEGRAATWPVALPA